MRRDEEVHWLYFHLLDDQGVQSSSLADLGSRGVLQVLLLPFASNGVLVSEDEVDWMIQL